MGSAGGRFREKFLKRNGSGICSGQCEEEEEEEGGQPTNNY